MSEMPVRNLSRDGRTRHYRDFGRPPEPLVAPCDRCGRKDAVNSTECFGCRQAALKVWPHLGAIDSGQLSGC